MPQHTPAQTHRCADCGDFQTVAVTTGTRHRDGSRATVRVTCHTCSGSGVAPRTASVFGPAKAGAAC
ncbi:hypothetical protein ACFY41_14935 [Streptomyces syringium]|uniref:hypothetical protein n=1 Tax=Streptomyces syringium TaxID=76729 RepID=UPI00368D8A1C